MSLGPDTAVLRTQLTGLLLRPGRLVMTGLSVLVAAFVVFGTVMAQQITARTTLDHFSGTPAATSLVVTAEQETNLTDAQLRAVRAVPGVAEVAARLDNGAPVAGAAAERYLQLKSDPGTGPLARVRVVTGSYPDGPKEVAINRRAAETLDLAPGAHLTLQFPVEGDGEKTRSATVTVTAVVQEAGTAARMTTGYAPAGALAALVGVKGHPRLDIRVEAGASTQEVSQHLRALFPRTGDAAVSIVSGSTVRAQEAREAVAQFDEAFEIIAMFLAIAVVAAALVATSTFRIVFAQRLRQLALLRMIGAHRGRLVRALAAEGALVGLVAGTLGVLLALGAGHAAPAIAATGGQALSAPGVPVLPALAVVLGAILVTVGAVLAPAVSAAGVSPLHALRSAGTAVAEGGIGRLRLGAGLLLVAGSAGLVIQLLDQLPAPGDESYDSSSGLMMIVVSGALAFLALIALGPLLVRPVLAAAGWPLRRLGPTGAIAVSGVGGAPRRAAAVSVVVALGVMLVSGTLVGIASLRGHTDQKLAVQAPADFHLSAPDKGLSADAVRRIQDLPNLTDVVGYRQVEVSIGAADAAADTVATDLDLTALPTSAQLGTATGSLDALGPGQVVVDDLLAEELGVTTGDSITVASAKGTIRLSVAATLPGDAPLSAGLVVVRADLDRMGAGPQPTGILADAAEDGLAARGAAQEAIAEIVGDSGAGLQTPAEYRDNTNDDLSLVETTALGLLGLTVLIAVVGVGTTTGLTVLERSRESGLLRVLGLSRARLRSMIGIEAGLYGVLGGVLGLLLGIPYAWLAIRALNLGAPLLLPFWQLLAVFLGLLAVTAAAGLLPARRAARVSPVAALGTAE